MYVHGNVTPRLNVPDLINKTVLHGARNRWLIGVGHTQCLHVCYATSYLILCT